MTDTNFLPRDATKALYSVKEELYNRLKEVQEAIAMPVDDFDRGCDCRLADEETWLLNLLDKIEKS